MGAAVIVIAVAGAAWAGLDAAKLGARRGRLGGGLLDQGPLTWFAACLLVWIVAFPCYLVIRPKLLAAAAPPTELPWSRHPEAPGRAGVSAWLPSSPGAEWIRPPPPPSEASRPTVPPQPE